VAGIVLLSMSATPGEELLIWQARQIAPTLPAPVRGLLRLLRTDLVTKVAANHRRIKATTTDVARIGGVKINAKWTREFMAHDPRTDLARIGAPCWRSPARRTSRCGPTTSPSSPRPRRP
jgi:hypothetical protein